MLPHGLGLPMATTYGAARDGFGARFFRALAGKWDAWRVSRLEQRLAPAEARFFDAYGRGGSHRGGDLVVDFMFTTRPGVREILRGALRGTTLDLVGLEVEYAAWEPTPDFARFRANAEHLASILRNA